MTLVLLNENPTPDVIRYAEKCQRRWMARIANQFVKSFRARLQQLERELAA